MVNYFVSGFQLSFPESTFLSVYSLASSPVRVRNPHFFTRLSMFAPLLMFLYSYKCNTVLVEA
jgi:hypothetical protein